MEVALNKEGQGVNWKGTLAHLVSNQHRIKTPENMERALNRGAEKGKKSTDEHMDALWGWEYRKSGDLGNWKRMLDAACQLIASEYFSILDLQ